MISDRHVSFITIGTSDYYFMILLMIINSYLDN